VACWQNDQIEIARLLVTLAIYDQLDHFATVSKFLSVKNVANIFAQIFLPSNK
jgi:hypothetical protein